MHIGVYSERNGEKRVVEGDRVVVGVLYVLYGPQYLVACITTVEEVPV